MQVKLQLKTKSKLYRIRVGEDPVTLGRKRPSTYIIDDPLLSSAHCELIWDGEILHIKDLDSKNGVILNGMRISKQRLHINDTVKLGTSELSIDAKATPEEIVEKIGESKGIDRPMSLELDLRASKDDFKKNKKQKFSKQNQKLFHGLEHLENKKPTNQKKDFKKAIIIVAVVFILLLVAKEFLLSPQESSHNEQPQIENPTDDLDTK